ncbi:MoaD/ThiS family protein [Aciditerrimonas ferrireducens]|uniref:MoaD/ThiS family protein n=1 Tax=Aciditerrimonas ferrireducens TaxID=667306 RepID=UPI0020032FEB|nr:MoaD/ThiS family protein [Aciditerrimonas ferrireducens]MCK4176816.1 MoaD/ThiS family protein [Aciditerrimonas ferrireducens]
MDEDREQRGSRIASGVGGAEGQGAVRVRLRNPSREVSLPAPTTVGGVLEALGLPRASHLVIVNGELVPGEHPLGPGDEVEVRPVVSGGAR